MTKQHGDYSLVQFYLKLCMGAVKQQIQTVALNKLDRTDPMAREVRRFFSSPPVFTSCLLFDMQKRKGFTWSGRTRRIETLQRKKKIKLGRKFGQNTWF